MNNSSDMSTVNAEAESNSGHDVSIHGPTFCSFLRALALLMSYPHGRGGGATVVVDVHSEGGCRAWYH